MLKFIISPFALLLTLTTSTGILMHESKIDSFAVLSLTSPVAVAKDLASGKLLETHPHTHSEAGSLEASSREYRAKTPSIAPRRDREKYRLQKNVPRGYHLFDSYHLPLTAFS